jgi:glycosyltransferase involved in cell wall biosynthesis
MDTHPLVSVIIPTYNYAHFICEAIDSVLASNFPLNEVEIIVIDDGSTDDTAEKVKVYDDKVKYILQDNLGKACATKVGIDHAKGKYIFNLDADDLFLPNKLKEVVEIFENDSDIVHVAHPALCWQFDDDIKTVEPVPESILGRKIFGKELLYYFYKRGILFGGGSTFAVRAEILKQASIPKTIDMLIDEYLALISLNQGHSFFIEQPLSIWRIHGKNYSTGSITNTQRAQLKRKLESLKAAVDNLPSIKLEKDMEGLYKLRNRTLALYLKEKTEDKSFADILSLWSCILNVFVVFGIDGLGIVKNYPIWTRTLPTFLVNQLKYAKKSEI